LLDARLNGAAVERSAGLERKQFEQIALIHAL
jgi:hypothetical protein